MRKKPPIDEGLVDYLEKALDNPTRTPTALPPEASLGERMAYKMGQASIIEAIQFLYDHQNETIR